MNAKQIIEKWLPIQQGYAMVQRVTAGTDRYLNLAHDLAMFDPKDYGHIAVREPLVEHVGHLPALATFLYPYLEYRDKVDLGRTLQLLAIHDIGETVVGDKFVFDKTDAEEDEEEEAALAILDPMYHDLYLEFEKLETYEAKLAMALDKLAPKVKSIQIPDVWVGRMVKNGYNMQTIINKQRDLYTWDANLLAIFDVVMEHATAIEAGDEPLFEIIK